MRAAIDIGSNSVRLYLETGEAVCRKELDSTALGEGLALTGRLSDAAMERTAAAVLRFVKKARASGAAPIFIFATEAVRAAANGKEFAVKLERATGLPVDVVDGETEARLGLLGALDPARPKRELTVIDIGGASVEIVTGNIDAISYTRSLPLGMLRLRDICGDDRTVIEAYAREKTAAFGYMTRPDPTDQTSSKAPNNHFSSNTTIDRISSTAPVDYSSSNTTTEPDLHEKTSGLVHTAHPAPVAIGGTATALAAMYLALPAYDPQKVHGTVIPLRGLDELTDRIFASTDRIRDFPTLSPRRALVIGHGAIMLSAILRHLSATEVTVSERDNLEGYLLLRSVK